MSTICTSLFPMNQRKVRGTILGLTLASLILGAGLAGVADAALQGIATTPAEPTSCDPVGLTVSGVMPDPCYEVIGAELFGPEPLPTMDPTGPVPTYGIRVRIVVRVPNPNLEIACVTVITPYEKSFRLGRLRPGIYHVNATEVTVPFGGDPSVAMVDSSQLSASFTVRPDICDLESCYLLGFAPASTDLDHRLACTAIAPPGGSACVAVTLGNEVAVGGVETEVQLTTDGRQPLPDGWFEVIGVEPAPRAGGFEAAWTAQGSTVKVVLFSATGQSIAPGQGPIFRVCYRLAEDVPVGSSFPLHFGPTIVADSQGMSIQPCETFAEPTGRICVGRQGCDLNGDGRSDVRDVILLVRCILASPAGDGGCPDSIAARADCNGDGGLDVRDVICCVRRILGDRLGLAPGESPGATDGALGAPTRIRFLGPVEWAAGTEGRAILVVDPGPGFGGAMFRVSAHGAPARIRGLRLLDSGGGVAFESMTNEPGDLAAAMLYPSRLDASLASPIRVEVILEPRGDWIDGGWLRVEDAASATTDGEPIPTDASLAVAAVPASPVAAPRLYAPRPNPFATESEITFAIPATSRVALRIYDVRGRFVRSLEDGIRPAGVHRAHWDGRDESGRVVGTGVYYLRLEADGVSRTARIVRTR